MLLASGSGVGKKFGNQLCFEGVDFQIHSGRRVGLIGRNGCGKTTLFKLITGEDDDHSGNISRKSDMQFGRSEQSPEFPEDTTVIEAVMSAVTGILEIQKEIEAVHHELSVADEHDKLLAKLERLEKRFEACSGHDVERRAEALLDGFGFSEKRRSEPVSVLSGGEKNRVALARVLVAQPDLWLLDEPTNHLDLDGIAFLEKYLINNNISAVIVSHDRRFLDRVCDETWEIENKKLFVYDGNYSTSRRLREERMLSAWREYERQKEYIAKQEEFIRRYGAGQRAREAKGRAKRLSRVERLERPEQKARMMALSLSPCARLGNDVLKLENLEKSYDGRTLFEKLSFELAPGETVGIVGPNGCGKSTLFRIITQKETADNGDFSWGQTVKIGQMDQNESDISDQYTPLSYLRTNTDLSLEQSLRDILAAMLFKEGDFDKSVSVLSGGERKRLALTRLLIEGHNVLLLDEPTNHLDIAGCESLELALSGYEGNIVVISHDRYFLDQLCDRILWFEDGAWFLSEGDFTAAQARRDLRKAEEAEKRESEKKKAANRQKQTQNTQKSAQKRSKGPYAKLSVMELEKRIVAHEDRKEEINHQFTLEKVYTSAESVKKLHAELSELEADLELLEEEYLLR